MVYYFCLHENREIHKNRQQILILEIGGNMGQGAKDEDCRVSFKELNIPELTIIVIAITECQKLTHYVL